MYCDSHYPFGHELVLYCLLTIDDSKEYPWNRYILKSKGSIYKDIAYML